MSKSTNQTILLLSVAAGSLVLLKELPATDDLRNKVQEAHYLIKNTILEYPTTMKHNNYIWVMDHISKWEKYVQEEQPGLDYHLLTAIAHQCISDLLSKLKDKHKKKLLENIFTKLNVISDILDPTGKNYEHYDRASFLLKKLYINTEFYL